MSNIDGPDYQRGVVASEGEEGAFGGGILSTVVDVTPGQKALWIFGEGIVDPLPTVTGITTGYEYPVFWAPWQSQAEPAWFSVVALLTGAFDTAVRIQWSAAPSNLWWVVADNGGRFVLDAALANTINGAGEPAPGVGVTVAGSDGTDTRVLLTDSSGRLETTDSGLATAIGQPGHAAPADAVQVGGTDGTDLRALLTDTAGHALTVDQTLKLAIAALGAAIPADAVLVAGSDGTDLRALLTDTAGHALTVDQTLRLAIAALGAAIPADAVLVAGSDGTDLRAVLVDASGHALTIDQTLKLAIAANAAAVPADVVLVGGSDGVLIHAIKIDSAGNVVVRDVTMDNAVGVPGTAQPSDGVLIMGSDGTDGRAPLTDTSGHLLTIDQTLKLAIAAAAAAVPADVVQVGGSDGTDLRAERVTTTGVQYAIPMAPSTVAADHPPVEITVQAISAGTGLAAPGATRRIRVFKIQPVLGAAANAGTVTWQPLGFGSAQTMLGFGGASGPYVREGIDMPLTGLPMAANTGITWNDITGVNGAVVFYVIENV